MPYSSLTSLHRLHTMTEDLAEAARLVELCEAVSTLRGRRPAGAGARPAGGVPRPTEDTALDEARLGVVNELRTAESHLLAASAYVKGVVAALDRALSGWEGRPGAGDGAE